MPELLSAQPSPLQVGMLLGTQPTSPKDGTCVQRDAMLQSNTSRSCVEQHETRLPTPREETRPTPRDVNVEEGAAGDSDVEYLGTVYDMGDGYMAYPLPGA